jgi:hypothetical protein
MVKLICKIAIIDFEGIEFVEKMSHFKSAVHGSE